jgi:CHRD domain
MRRMLIATAVLLPALIAGLAATAHGGEAGVEHATAAPSKITICHRTGSATNPWRRITISSRAWTKPNSPAGQTLRGHMRHVGDAVVVGTAPCPPAAQAPTPSNTRPTKITICHRTGTASNPYRRITVSMNALQRPGSPAGVALRGHMRHTGDILFPGVTPCPAGTPNLPGRLGANLQPVAGATGSGTARFTVRLGRNELCYTLTVTGLTNLTAAHIHRVAGGAIVVPSSGSFNLPTTGTSSGCTGVDPALLREIVQTPGAFYVNVHTQSFQSGQVQGTLSK